MKELLLKAIKCLLPLFGVAVFDSCAVKAEYGCPHADFEAKGVVTDEDGNGIQGIRVVISAELPNPIFDPITDTLWTAHDGTYIKDGGYLSQEFAHREKVKLEFEDVDGLENGGEFQKIEIQVPVFQVREGDGDWYMGAYETGADVTMLKK